MKSFTKINPSEINDNPFVLLEKDWMLITAGNINDYNMMTAAWGGFGFLWKKPVVYIFIRPQRHTFNYTENNIFFTLTFFDSNYRNILNTLGTKSGKDFNKMKISGLTPLITPNNSVAFEESRLIFECKQIYKDDIKEKNFTDNSPLINYPQKDFHKMYIGEILNIFTK